MQNQQATDWRGSKLIGATVYGTDNSSIGEVNDLVLASDGKVNGVVIGVGGFLGVGEKNVAVPFEKLTVTRKADSAAIDKITVSFTKDELKNAPTFAFYEGPTSSTTGSSTTERPRGTAPMGGSAPAR
jgi:sporulation protein YlmC with PRC-barrel domain